MNENFNSLVRRIGFTASLESVLERSIVLTNALAESPRPFKLNSAIWASIVRNEFGKTSSKAIEEMANPYHQLQIINKS